MSLPDDQQQNIQMKLDFSSALTGAARGVAGEETESSGATSGPENPAKTHRLMEEVCERENLKEALRQVKDNKGSSGVDGMTVVALSDYLKRHWPAIREQLLNGTYEPQPVRRVEIPKPDGGVRKLGSTVGGRDHAAGGGDGPADGDSGGLDGWMDVQRLERGGQASEAAESPACGGTC